MLLLVQASIASGQELLRLPLQPGRRTATLVHGDTVWVRTPPASITRYVYTGNTIVMRRSEFDTLRSELTWVMQGDSAFTANPRRAIPAKALLDVRKHALQERSADSLLKGLGRP
jgi:hypothetical protein